MAKDVNDPISVTQLIQKLEPNLAQLVEAIRQQILKCGADVGEQIKWNSPSFFYMGEMAAFDPKEYKRDILVINVRKNMALLVFPTGAQIADSTGLLEGNYTDGRRIARFKSLTDVQTKGYALQTVVKQWLALVEKP